MTDEARATTRLPEDFVFTTVCCGHSHIGRGRCVSGVWTETTVEVIPWDSQGIAKTLAAKLVGAEVYTYDLEVPATEPQSVEGPPQPRPSSSDMTCLRMSPALRQAVDALTKTGMEISAAVSQLAQTCPDLFSEPGDRVARLIVTAEDGQRDEPHESRPKAEHRKSRRPRKKLR